MGWKLKIPKILHVYWGGSPLTYLRFLTIKTFQEHNPDWEIRFYYPTHPTTNQTWFTPEQKNIVPATDFAEEVKKTDGITKIPVDFEKFGVPNTIPEVHKSDLIRLILLSSVGGLWSDMDIFYFKPISTLYLNDEKYKDLDTVYCNREYGHSVGFLMSTPESPFFKELLRQSQTFYHAFQYQTFGAFLYNKDFRPDGAVEKIAPNSENILMDVVYSHRAGDTITLLQDRTPNFTKHSIGIHWFGGDQVWKDFMERTDGGLKNVPKCVIGDLINKDEKIMEYITNLK